MLCRRKLVYNRSRLSSWRNTFTREKKPSTNAAIRTFSTIHAGRPQDATVRRSDVRDRGDDDTDDDGGATALTTTTDERGTNTRRG